MTSATVLTAVALVRANVRYWPTVAPLTARELRRWEHRADDIPDPGLRELALSKLREEHFNAQVAATLATLLPCAARPAAVRALVALEVAYDYLDGLTERPAPNPLQSALVLFASFTGALEPFPSGGWDPRREAARSGDGEDGGYLDALAQEVRGQLAGLPAWRLLAPVAQAAAARTAQAQARLHAAPALADAQLQQWARPLAARSGLGWREFVAGAAASVLACHALIVAAADPATTRTDAERIDGFYLRLCALSTLLDALIDRDRDLQAGTSSLLRFYRDERELALSARCLAREASMLARALPDGPHHLMIMLGVVSYYTSAPGAGSTLARPVRSSLWRELSPLIFPTLAVMAAWRAAKRLRALTSAEGSARWCERLPGCRL